MNHFLTISGAIDKFLLRVGMGAGWLFVLLTAAIVVDIVTRKLGIQVPGLSATRFQELEWHLHIFLFSAWYGAAYIKGSHVRVDVIAQHWKPRTRAWVELVGICLFAIPVCLLGLYFSFDYALIAWTTNESSNLGEGIAHRWVPKGVIAVSVALLLLATVSVALRTIVSLRLGAFEGGDRAATGGGS